MSDTTPKFPARDESGYTLIELAVAVPIVGAVLAAVYGLAYWLTDGAIVTYEIPPGIAAAPALLGVLMMAASQRRTRTTTAASGTGDPRA